jgi:hypothetical protein
VNHFHCAAITIAPPGFADNFARRGNLRVQTIFAKGNDLAITTRDLEARPHPHTGAEILNRESGISSSNVILQPECI